MFSGSAALQELQCTMLHLPPSALFEGLEVQEPFVRTSAGSGLSDRGLEDETVESEEDPVEDRDIFFRCGTLPARRAGSPPSTRAPGTGRAHESGHVLLFFRQ